MTLRETMRQAVQFLGTAGRQAAPLPGIAGSLTRPSGGGSGFVDGFVEGLGQGVPREGGAFDAYRELHHSPQCLEVTEGQRGGVIFGLGLGWVGADVRSVDRHHGLERRDESSGVGHRLALDGG